MVKVRDKMNTAYGEMPSQKVAPADVTYYWASENFLKRRPHYIKQKPKNKMKLHRNRAAGLGVQENIRKRGSSAL